MNEYCCISEQVVRVSLNLDDVIVKDRLTGNIQDINHLNRWDWHTANPKDCKNLMLDAEFLLLMQLDKRVIER